jgi:hypothetical protein
LRPALPLGVANNKHPPEALVSTPAPSSVPLVEVKAGKVPRELYDLSPERALNFGFALYRLSLARKAQENAQTKGRLAVEDALRLSDTQFRRYVERARTLLGEGLLAGPSDELAEEVGLEAQEPRQAQKIVRLYESILEKYEGDPTTREGTFARRFREAAFAYAQGMLSAKRDKDEEKLTAWEVRIAGTQAKDLLLGALGFLRGAGAVLAATGLSTLLARYAVLSLPDLSAQAQLLAQVGAGVFGFSITVFILLFFSGSGIESVDHRWRLAVAEATNNQNRANSSAREISLAIACDAWRQLTGEEFDCEQGLLPILRTQTGVRESKRYPTGPLSLVQRVRFYFAHRKEMNGAFRDAEAAVHRRHRELGGRMKGAG